MSCCDRAIYNFQAEMNSYVVVFVKQPTQFGGYDYYIMTDITLGTTFFMYRIGINWYISENLGETDPLNIWFQGQIIDFDGCPHDIDWTRIEGPIESINYTACAPEPCIQNRILYGYPPGPYGLYQITEFGGYFEGVVYYALPYFLGYDLTYYIYTDQLGTWYVSGTVGYFGPDVYATIASESDLLPIGVWNVTEWGSLNFNEIEYFETLEGCGGECPCIFVEYYQSIEGGGSELLGSFSATVAGIFNFYNYYEFIVEGETLYLWFDGEGWKITTVLGVNDSITYVSSATATGNNCPENYYQNVPA